MGFIIGYVKYGKDVSIVTIYLGNQKNIDSAAQAKKIFGETIRLVSGGNLHYDER
jgi:hypothetical protein